MEDWSWPHFQLLWISLPPSFEGGTRVAERLGQRNLTKSGFPAAVVQLPPFLLKEAKGWRSRRSEI